MRVFDGVSNVSRNPGLIACDDQLVINGLSGTRFGSIAKLTYVPLAGPTTTLFAASVQPFVQGTLLPSCGSLKQAAPFCTAPPAPAPVPCTHAPSVPLGTVYTSIER